MAQGDTPVKAKSLNQKVETKVKNAVTQGKLKLDKVVDDISKASNGDLKKVSPDGHKVLMDFVSDAVFDEMNSDKPPGISVPIEFMLDLPDQSRLRLWYDPKTKQTDLRFGVRF